MKTATKKRLLISGGIILLAIAVIASFGFWLYSNPASPAKIKVLANLNLPVAKVGRSFIGARELFSRYETAVKLYGSDKSFQPGQSQSDILNRLIETKKLDTIAGSRGVRATGEEVQAEYSRFAAQEGGLEKFEETLTQEYYLSPEQFKEKALLPDVLKAKLAISYYNDQSLNPDLHKTLAAINTKLSQNVPFSDLAKMYSEDPATRQFGGDSGEIPNADLVPELQAALAGVQPDQTATVTTRLGIYVIKVVNRKEDSVAGGSVHFLAIFLNYGKINSQASESAFTKWYAAQAGGIPTKKYINL